MPAVYCRWRSSRSTALLLRAIEVSYTRWARILVCVQVERLTFSGVALPPHLRKLSLKLLNFLIRHSCRSNRFIFLLVRSTKFHDGALSLKLDLLVCRSTKFLTKRLALLNKRRTGVARVPGFLMRLGDRLLQGGDLPGLCRALPKEVVGGLGVQVRLDHRVVDGRADRAATALSQERAAAVPSHERVVARVGERRDIKP